MIHEARRFGSNAALAPKPFRIGVSSSLGTLPSWKHEADFLFVQVSFSFEDLLRWRETVDFSGPIFAGVMAPPSAAMARKLSAQIPQLAVPESLIEALERHATRASTSPARWSTRFEPRVRSTGFTSFPSPATEKSRPGSNRPDNPRTVVDPAVGDTLPSRDP